MPKGHANNEKLKSERISLAKLGKSCIGSGIYLHKKIQGMFGKKHTVESKLKMSKSRDGRFRDKDCPNYKNGLYTIENRKCYKHYNNTFVYKRWRTLVFERDNYTCQNCNQVGGYLTAHHIKSWAKNPELRYSVINGLTLCEECHKLTDNYKGRGIKK